MVDAERWPLDAGCLPLEGGDVEVERSILDAVL